MKYLVVVRHANIYQTMDSGTKKEVLQLAERLKPYAGEKVRVVSSQEARAQLTGKVFAEVFETKLQCRGELNPPAWAFVESAQELGKDVDMLIIVAHDDTCSEFPSEFGRTVLNIFIPSGYLGYLEELVIDCESKEVFDLP